MSYWVNNHCYKTLEDALIAYEEYKKKERIFKWREFNTLPCNLNLRNHYQEVVLDVTEETSAYDVLGNKIATWGASSQNNTRVSNYVDFGPPHISGAKIGTLYFDKDTNKIWVLNSEKKWIHIANYSECKATAAKDNKNIINCRNCGAPLKSHICEYCGTRY